jgi:hypothetical protein
MNYNKINSFPKKPETNQENKQLFSFDIGYNGAKISYLILMKICTRIL